MVLGHPRKPHVGMLGPSRHMIVDKLGFSPLGGNPMQRATPILLSGFALPFLRPPLWISSVDLFCGSLLWISTVDLYCGSLLWISAVARADRVALKVQYPRTPKRPGVPRERERTFISAGDAVSNLV